MEMWVSRVTFFHVLPKCSEKDTVREGGGG